MSATSSQEKVWDVCTMYEARGFEDIEILTITLHGPLWDHEKSRLWHLETRLADIPRLNERYRSYYAHEYLIQDSIPLSCVERSK